MADLTPEMMGFITDSPTPFHAAANICDRLKTSGFQQLFEKDSWQLRPGGKYFVVRNESAVFAFVCGQKKPWESGFRLAGAHTDSPALRLKPKGELIREVYGSARVEVYGGVILSTWLDRELGLAGRVMVSNNSKIESRLYNSRRPVGMVPNLAIHMNREVNKGFEFNPHTQMCVVFSADPQTAKPGFLGSWLAQELGVRQDAIMDADLLFYDAAPSRTFGISNDFIVSPRLDNLAMTHAILSALVVPATPAHTSVGLFFDNEETGSCTYQGADSTFARDILERITILQGGGREEFLRASANSFLISADMAHGVHPNFAEKHDDRYGPVINGGPVIKHNGNNRYATTAETAAIFEKLCNEAKVPVQRVINRADVPCGSTIGPISAAGLSIKTVDVGNPMWAMHSARETAGVRDHGYMIQALSLYFSGNFAL